MTKALILKAQGTNCDAETHNALCCSGADPNIVYVGNFLRDPGMLGLYDILVIPGGFSYGDYIAGGRIFANELKANAGDHLKQFVDDGKPVVGICNGCQVLAEMGYVPGLNGERKLAFVDNDSGHYREVFATVVSGKNRCEFVPEGMRMRIPIAHAEGRYVVSDDDVFNELEEGGYHVFRFEGDNPNGSRDGITGVTDKTGLVLAMMPHPEREILNYDREAKDSEGIEFWVNLVDFAKGKKVK